MPGGHGARAGSGEGRRAGAPEKRPDFLPAGARKPESGRRDRRARPRAPRRPPARADSRYGTPAPPGLRPLAGEGGGEERAGAGARPEGPGERAGSPARGARRSPQPAEPRQGCRSSRPAGAAWRDPASGAGALGGAQRAEASQARVRAPRVRPRAATPAYRRETEAREPGRPVAAPSLYEGSGRDLNLRPPVERSPLQAGVAG